MRRLWIGLIYSRRESMTEACTAKLIGLSLEEVKAVLERPRAASIVVKRGERYGRPHRCKYLFRRPPAQEEGGQPRGTRPHVTIA